MPYCFLKHNWLIGRFLLPKCQKVTSPYPFLNQLINPLISRCEQFHILSKTFPCCFHYTCLIQLEISFANMPKIYYTVFNPLINFLIIRCESSNYFQKIGLIVSYKWFDWISLVKMLNYHYSNPFSTLYLIPYLLCVKKFKSLSNNLLPCFLSSSIIQWKIIFIKTPKNR